MLLLVQPLVAISVFTLFGLLYGAVILLTRSKLDRDSERISFEQDEVVKKLQEGFPTDTIVARFVGGCVRKHL